ncbi:MAG: lipoate--protein ligase family protein [Planctomycetota bacterium]|nr:MAG: lipoate--protein ligase family protein [Planctomycetota bacterium]
MLRIIDDKPAPGPENMARDEALLALATVPTLRLYGWQPPCLSLGLFQDYAQVCAQAPAGVPMVRRITGGGTIFHIHEVTYAIIGQLGADGWPNRLRDAYPLIHGTLLAQLRRHGAQLQRQPESIGDRRYHQEVRCFASPATDDLVAANGAKALGSAGRNRQGRFLVHGSLKLASNPWDGNAVCGCGLDSIATAKDCLRATFTEITGLSAEAGELTPEEAVEAKRIAQARYGDDAWLARREGPRP